MLNLFFLVLILLSAPYLKRFTLAEKAAVSRTLAGDLEARNKNAFALILGEIRATAADLMFIKTERYLHSGVAYKPHMDLGHMGRTGELDAKEESHSHHPPGSQQHPTVIMETSSPESSHAGHKHDGACTHAGGVPTLIRTASQDFRGFLGDLERATKPYLDPKHDHHVTTGDELLPWYRLMTLSDPHNLRGYMIGTMLLTYAKKPDEALAFIQEGIDKNRGNPQAYRLYVSLAQVHWKSGRLERSLAAAKTGFEMAKAVRPHGGEIGAARKGVLWTEDLENDFLFVARFVPLFLERKGDIAQALRVAREIASLAPEDVPTAELIAKLESELSGRRRPAG